MFIIFLPFLFIGIIRKVNVCKQLLVVNKKNSEIEKRKIIKKNKENESVQ